MGMVVGVSSMKDVGCHGRMVGVVVWLVEFVVLWVTCWLGCGCLRA